jgi:hypothetical protein
VTRAECETGNLTHSIMAQARARLTDAGVEFQGEAFDTGVCPMSFFDDPNGNALMLHHRYAPRTPPS